MANYWHCLPMYEQARKAIWEAINPHTGRRRIDEAFPKELRARTDNQSMTIEFKIGSIWKVVGSDNPDSLVGAPPAGIVFSEWALANPNSWAYLAPILAENGGWADFITTPRGRNHVRSMHAMAKDDPAWFTQVLTVDDTLAIDPSVIEQQRKEYHSLYGEDEGDALIEQEYWCSFEAAIVGAYYGKEMVRAEKEGRLTGVEYDENAPVHTAWDLGVGDTNPIWFFQMIGGEIHVVDYYEAHGYAINHYAKVVRDKPWALDWNGKRTGYDFVPHDALQRSYTAGDKETGKARQRIEVMVDCGLRPRLVPLHRVDDGISAVRQSLPRCWFDAKRCEAGIEGLRQYSKEWDDKKKSFKDMPLHNWASHPADAFRTLAMGWQQPKLPKAGPKPIVGLEALTMDRLWEDEKRRKDQW